MITTDYNGLKPYQKELLAIAEKAMPNAFEPLSGFMVGAAVEASNGIETKIFAGVNREASNYSLTNCAERAAIDTATTQGYTKVRKVAVIAKPREGSKEEPTAPCGSCRQVIYDMKERDAEIIYSNSDKSKVKIASMDELLPDAFGFADLADI